MWNGILKGLCLLSVLMSGCAPSLKSSEISKRKNEVGEEVSVVIDPRIELMTIIQRLSGYFVLSSHESRSSSEVEDHYSNFFNHPVVDAYASLTEAGFAFDQVPRFMMHFDEEPGLELIKDWRGEIGIAPELVAKLERYSTEMRDFANKSEFHHRHLLSQSYHELMTAQVRPHIEQLSSQFYGYTGIALESATVILSPQMHDGGFATYFAEAPLGPHAYAFIGPSGSDGTVPTFGGRDRLFHLVMHEFLHLVVNPLTDNYREEIEARRSLFEPVAEDMRRHAYGRWDVTFSEHVVRAVTIRMAADVLGQEAADKLAEKEAMRGFLYVSAMLEALKSYELHRDRYPTLPDFFPILIEALDESARDSTRAE